MELRLLVRALAVAAAILTILSIVLNNLLYIPGLLVGLTDVIVYHRIKPSDVRPYFFIALVASIVAFGIFVIEGILGLVFFIQTT